MNQDNTRLLEKIQALLNKAGDSGVTEAESQAFFAKAMELLAKNGLHTADLEKIKQDADKKRKPDYGIQHSTASTGRGKHEADDYIWPILNRCFGVKTLFTTEWGTKNHAWLFVGDEVSVRLAELGASVLYKAMTRNCRKYIKEHGLKKTSNIKRSYYAGVKAGYLEKIQEAEAAAYAEATAGQRDAYGIVLAGKSEAIELYTNEKLNPRSMKSRNKGGTDYDAFRKGQEIGRNLDLNFDNKLNG